MDATPAPKSDRLDHAEKLVAEAARAGAQLVVLPELFNTGYAYTDANFLLAEPLNGMTGTWLNEAATRFNIHLAGTFLHLERGEIYNTMLLFSPAGNCWRYDKSYPWAWERGYFRGKRGTTIAKTELGDLGMMICWDIGHLNMWKQYAGKIDMIIIASCPPNAGQAAFDFPDGEKIDFNEMGPQMNSLEDVGPQFFGEMVYQQARWLGVPVVNSGASGNVRTYIPRATTLLRMFALAQPRLGALVPKASQLQMSCGMIPSCKIVDAGGQQLAECDPTAEEGFVVADVTLGNTKSMPKEKQPVPPLKLMDYRLSVFNADVMVPAVMKRVYKNGLRKIRN
jgi:predicted amidohydrolase